MVIDICKTVQTVCAWIGVFIPIVAAIAASNKTACCVIGVICLITGITWLAALCVEKRESKIIVNMLKEMDDDLGEWDAAE